MIKVNMMVSETEGLNTVAIKIQNQRRAKCGSIQPVKKKGTVFGIEV